MVTTIDPAIASAPAGFTQTTVGDFADENASKAEFERRLALCSRWFKVRSEVVGQSMQPKFGVEDWNGGLRIDYVLQPSIELQTAGWDRGCIGIECKRSGEKLGPVVSQCLDYTRSVWTVQPSGTVLLLQWVFIWPLGHVKGDIESVMAQHRIGSVGFDDWCHLTFRVGAQHVLRIDTQGNAIAKPPASGRKVGSR
jgi:hypothetical protein